MGKNKKKSKGLNVVLLVTTLVTAVPAALLVNLLHSILLDAWGISGWSGPVAVGLCFSVFLVIVGLCVLLTSNLMGTYRADVVTGRNSRIRVFAYILLGILVMMLVMGLAELLYECNFQGVPREPPATYVFMIDDSSSMEENDPGEMRYQVIERLLKDQRGDTQYTVYTFSRNAKLIVPMQTVEDGFPTYPEPDYKVTNMKRCMELVLDDYEKGVWSAEGAIKVILITDGMPTDMSGHVTSNFDLFTTVLDRFRSHGIAFNSVGVKNADDELMTRMANYTGGTHVRIDNAEDLVTAVSDATDSIKVERVARTLLTKRDEEPLNWLYALIRILSYTLSSVLLAATAVVCYGNARASGFLLMANAVKGLVAGVLQELLFRFLPENVAILIGFAVLGCVLSVYGKVGLGDGNTQKISADFDSFDLNF